jgi:hypothetical protein
MREGTTARKTRAIVVVPSCLCVFVRIPFVRVFQGMRFLRAVEHVPPFS